MFASNSSWFCIFWGREKNEKTKISYFFFLLILPFSGIQWKTQEIINAMRDLNLVQCSYHKTADHIRTRIHQVQHRSFNSHEYEGPACLEMSFLLAWTCNSKSPSLTTWLGSKRWRLTSSSWVWRLQTSVFNRENGADHSPFSILITLLAPETSCSNEFHNLITGVIWQSTSFVYSKTAVWNLHWGLSRFCIVRNKTAEQFTIRLR